MESSRPLLPQQAAVMQPSMKPELQGHACTYVQPCVVCLQSAQLMLICHSACSLVMTRQCSSTLLHKVNAYSQCPDLCLRLTYYCWLDPAAPLQQYKRGLLSMSFDGLRGNYPVTRSNKPVIHSNYCTQPTGYQWAQHPWFFTAGPK